MRTMFVYGTLRPGISNNTIRIPGRMYDMGGYPGVVLGQPGSKDTVVVERCEVNESRIPALDNYEGYDSARPDRSLFIRTDIIDPLDLGEPAEIYVFNFRGADETKFPRIEDGDWLRHRRQAQGSAYQMMGPQKPFVRQRSMFGQGQITTHTHDGVEIVDLAPGVGHNSVQCGCHEPAPVVIPNDPTILSDDLYEEAN